MTLFIYILRDFIKYVIGAIILSVFLFLLFDFIHKSTKYLEKYNPETGHLIRFYLYQIPSLLIQALPIASLLGSVICMLLLSRTNEITAMRAAGMGPLKIGTPIAVGGSILCLIAYGIGEFILPISSKKMHYVQSVLIEKDPTMEASERSRWIRGDDHLYNFKEYDPISKVMYGIRIIQTGKNFKPKKTIEAERGEFKIDVNEWELKNIKILYFWPNGTLSYTEKKESYIVSIPVDPMKLKKELRLPEELSIVELVNSIEQGESSGKDILAVRVDMHAKFAFYFASFVVGLIGIKFIYKSERSMETAKGVILAVAIGISYWFILNAGKAFGKRGTLSPFLSAWLANIVIFGISCFSILRERKT
ncbi:MAG: LPS export ABC transporter permease LptG [Oligoflexales bacterium]|nr:LPS export ABC transporter permease LptG [Oligoflexales bacterium]